MRKHDIFLLLFIALVIAFLPTESIGAAKRDSSNAPFATTQITSGGAGGVPVGTIIAWPVASDPEDPENWLECNGQAIDRTVYPELFAVIGVIVPDLRGRVLQEKGTPGQQIEAGLPNITGTVTSTVALAEHAWDGVFKNSKQSSRAALHNANKGGLTIHFDASLSSPVYGRSDTVQPPAYAVRYLIRALP